MQVIYRKSRFALVHDAQMGYDMKLGRWRPVRLSFWQPPARFVIEATAVPEV